MRPWQRSGFNSWPLVRGRTPPTAPPPQPPALNEAHYPPAQPPKAEVPPGPPPTHPPKGPQRASIMGPEPGARAGGIYYGSGVWGGGVMSRWPGGAEGPDPTPEQSQPSSWDPRPWRSHRTAQAWRRKRSSGPGNVPQSSSPGGGGHRFWFWFWFVRLLKARKCNTSTFFPATDGG